MGITPPSVTLWYCTSTILSVKHVAISVAYSKTVGVPFLFHKLSSGFSAFINISNKN
jgi:hypothetical protein